MEERKQSSSYVKLSKDQTTPLEDIVPGELNQPIEVPQVPSPFPRSIYRVFSSFSPLLLYATLLINPLNDFQFIWRKISYTIFCCKFKISLNSYGFLSLSFGKFFFEGLSVCVCVCVCTGR